MAQPVEPFKKFAKQKNFFSILKNMGGQKTKKNGTEEVKKFFVLVTAERLSAVAGAEAESGAVGAITLPRAPRVRES